MQQPQRQEVFFANSLGTLQDTLSLAGFSDVSDLDDSSNALDVFVGVGEIDLVAAQRLQECHARINSKRLRHTWNSTKVYKSGQNVYKDAGNPFIVVVGP